MKIKLQTAIYDTCPRCKERLKVHSYCRPCQREVSAEWYAKNRRKTLDKNKNRSKVILKYLSDYKSQHGCSRCGYNEHPCALDFHHVGDKEFPLNLAQRKRYGMERVKKEVSKCVVLCANCHRIHHHKEH